MLDLHVSLNRSNPQPLSLQLKEQLEVLLASGSIAPGERLPPIRRLAEQLGLAPMTVAQAYGLLEADGIVRSRRGAGTFVSWREPGAARTEASARALRLRQILQPALEQALDEGFSDDEIRKEAEISVQTLSNTEPPTAVFCGMTPTVSEKYAAWVERECRDLGLKVRAMPLGRVLGAPPGPGAVGGADLVVTLIYYVSDLRAHVGPTVEVFPILNMLKRESQEALATIPGDAVIGMVAQSDVRRALPAAVALFRPPERDTILAEDGDPVATAEIARRADVVIHLDTVPASYLEPIPARIPRIAVIYRPREDSLRDLRTLVQVIQHKKRDQAAGSRRAAAPDALPIKRGRASHRAVR